ncbi:unnamed protein product (macronuclear) [Paramecium tetraurelia]|uniref:Transmembrane protein n=1 Tax=Paramecium tetraurelia TaxID=5888 RepID=A0DD98_PARTE|nr:uncharacterized protein GSPATT00015874001 [Paramecium tetraurelia]CAK81015.1 unnamed protein product [Paramecium tetraurelia]|eukprot:XP_001448412.1 hypothetical protein (macronuclear) [Paramecium tetraurelia strain d4-2]
MKQHQKVLVKSRETASLLNLIFYVQLISLLLINEEEAINVKNQNYSFNLLQTFTYLNQIGRPYQILLSYQSFKPFAFLLPTTFLFLISIGFIKSFIVHYLFSKRQVQKTAAQNPDFNSQLSIIYQLYFYLLALYTFDFYIISIAESISNALITNIYVFVISVILLFNSVVFVFMNILCSESIHFKSSPLHVQQLQKYQFLNVILIILSMYFKSKSEEGSVFPVYILNILILPSYIYSESEKQANIYNKLSLIILSFGLFQNIFSLILIDVSFEYRIGLVFILCPFFINILNYYQKTRNQLNIKKSRNIPEIYQNLIILSDQKSKYSLKHQFDFVILNQKNEILNDQDLFQQELSLFNDRIVKASKSLKTFWYQKYIQIKYHQQNFTDTISLIYNFTQNQLYSESKKSYFKVSLSLSFLQRFQLELIQKEVYQLLYYNITKGNDSQENELARQYIIYSQIVQEDQQEVKNLFQIKEKIYQQMLQGKHESQNQLFNMAYSLTERGIKFLKKIKLDLYVHKSYRIQQLLIMLYVDFFNNVFQAEILRFSQIVNEDNKQNIYEQFSYIGLQILDDMENLEIIQYSQDIISNLGYSKSNIQHENFNFKNLIPTEFYEIHQFLIKRFLQTGLCKKSTKPYELLIKGNQETFFYIQLQLSVQPQTNNHIQIFAFIKFLESQPISLFINRDNKIIGFTNSFINQFKELGFDKKSLFQSDINKIISNFKKLPLQKHTKFRFMQTQQDISAIIIEKDNLFELQILDNSDFIIDSDQEQDGEKTVVKSFSDKLLPNQESFVIIPNHQFFEDINLPLSEERRDKTDQELLKEDQKKQCIVTIKSKFESDKNSDSLKNKDQKNSKNSLNLKQDEYNNDDQASSKFSKGFLDTAIFYSKYNQLNKFLENKKLLFIYVTISLLLFVLLINITYFIIQLCYIVPNFDEVDKDADLLSIKSNFLSPVHDCITSQSAFVNYYILNMYQVITLETALRKMPFSRDAITKSYLLLKASYIEQLNNRNLQEFFYDKYIEMKFLNNNTLEAKTIPLKTSLFNYLESQFFVISDNTNVDLSALNLVVSNEFVYFMANLLTIDNYFDSLSDEVSVFIIDRSLNKESEGTKIFLKMTFLQILFILLGFSYVLKNYQTHTKHFHLYTDINQYALQLELQRLNQIDQILNQENASQYYNFEIAIYEKKIQSNLSYYNQKINQVRLQCQQYKAPRLKILIIFLIMTTFILCPQVVLQQMDSDFYEKYQVSSYWVEKISQTSSALIAVYSYRDINYQIGSGTPYYFFYTDEQRILQNEKVEEELKKINMFITYFPYLDYDTMIIDDQTMEVLESIQSSNICNFMSHFNSSLAQEHCDSVYNGVMKLGLYNSISTLYELISQEYENTNGFQAKLRPVIAPFEDIELGMITSDAILAILDSILEGVTEAIIKLRLTHQIISIMYILLDLLLILVLFAQYFPFLVKQQNTVKSMIFLIPQYQFYLDQKFETNFRLLLLLTK